MRIKKEKRKRRYVQEVEYSVWIVPKWMSYLGWILLIAVFVGLYIPIYFEMIVSRTLIYIELVLGIAGILIAFFMIERLEPER